MHLFIDECSSPDASSEWIRFRNDRRSRRSSVSAPVVYGEFRRTTCRRQVSDPCDDEIYETDRVSLTSLLGLTRCNYNTENLPDCLSSLNPNSPEPMIEKQSGPEASFEGSFVENVAEKCQCSSDFDPVCDYGGFWYTNYCVSKCKGAKLVEHCTPVFKSVIKRPEPFVLIEADAPLMWTSGCFCPQDEDDYDPVCDINGRQYPSPCYAHCMVKIVSSSRLE